MNILVADDEWLVRESLISMLNEKLPKCRIREACSGQELVDLASDLQPDVAFVDIRMPGKNGLEAIREARSVAPDTQWIILTGFSEFEYAKEAIELQAFDYLLKPVDPVDLERPLRKLLASMQDRLARRNRHFEVEFTALLHGLTYDEEILRGCSFFTGRILYFDSTLPEQEYISAIRSIMEAVREEAVHGPNRDVLFAVSLMPEGELAIVGGCSAWVDRQDVARMTDRLERRLEEFRKPAFSITMLQMEDCSELKSLPGQIAELQRLAPYRAVLGISGVLTYSELRACEASPGNKELMQAVNRLVQAFKAGVYVSYISAVDDLDRILQTHSGNTASYRSAAARYLKAAIGSLWDGTGSGANGMKHLHGMGNLLVDHASKQAKFDLVEQTLAFIERRYMEEISLGDIAAKLGVTPNYLSSLFHQRTGTTFMKCVARNRIIKAKELLADPSIQVQQAAEMVGYFSTRHFTKLFTAFEGCSPSEYKKKLSLNDPPEKSSTIFLSR